MRLIDGDALIQKFNYADGDTEDERVWCATMRRMIKEQPTAYDIDKVVEELENECISPNDYPGYVVDLEKAIEIVKQGKEQNK